MGLAGSRKFVAWGESNLSNEMYFDFEIPHDLLIDVLSFVPYGDLIKHCRLVCKSWKEIIDGQGLWKIKCLRDRRYIPPIKFETIPLHYYRSIYIYNPYGINLLENSCGENALNKWTLVQNGGDGFVVEDPPNGADPVPSEVGLTKCFATSYFPNIKNQMIDLIAKGVHPEVIDSSSAKIEVGEWFAARFDCSSIYRLEVFLYGENYEPYIDCLDNDLKTPNDDLIDHFTFEYREEQWVGKEWHKVSHVFENVSKTRFICFQHFGKDGLFWAGHYGSKMTGAYVKIIV